MEIGTAIKTLRTTKKIKQKDLALKCRISINALSQIEINSTFPHKKTIDLICNALNIPVSYLLLFSISDEDVPENKRETFNYLNIAMQSLIKDSIK